MLQVVELYLDGSEVSVSQSTEMSLLVKAVAKRASPTVLLPALCNMWERTLAAQAQVCVLIFALMFVWLTQQLARTVPEGL